MSQENMEIVRRLFDAFTNRGDLRTSAMFLDESIVFDTRGMEWEDEDFVRVRWWVKVKRAWRLTVTAAEKSELRSMLATC